MAYLKSVLVLALASLTVAAALVAAQSTVAPNELRKVDPSKESNQHQNQQPQGSTERDTNNGVTPTGEEGDLRLPSNNQLVPTQGDDDNSNTDNESENNVFPFDPLGIFEPRPRPDRPHRGGMFGFFQDPMRHFNRHREMMDQQFRQLEKQAAEGQSISYFTRNGVGYKKVCTIERIGQQDQQQQPQQQQQQQQ